MITTTFDWSECLRQSGNKEDLANDFLGLFEKELPTFQKDLLEAMQSNNFDQLKYHSHKLLGACYYTGVPQLKTLTEQLETELHSQQENHISKLVNEISQEIDNVLQALKSR